MMPLFWFIKWTLDNRGADEEAWMVNRYYFYHPEEIKKNSTWKGFL